MSETVGIDLTPEDLETLIVSIERAWAAIPAHRTQEAQALRDRLKDALRRRGERPVVISLAAHSG